MLLVSTIKSDFDVTLRFDSQNIVHMQMFSSSTFTYLSLSNYLIWAGGYVRFFDAIEPIIVNGPNGWYQSYRSIIELRALWTFISLTEFQNAHFTRRLSTLHLKNTKTHCPSLHYLRKRPFGTIFTCVCRTDRPLRCNFSESKIPRVSSIA